MSSTYTKRYLANIVIEATTPLKVGSSDLDMLQDAPVQKDWNGLPMILGTSIAGVLRKTFDSTFANEMFGDEGHADEAKGSRIIISNALLCDKSMQVIEQLETTKSTFLKHFDNLPIREHVKITHKGVADSANSGKFDEEVVYKGTRFKFRLEFIGNEGDDNNFKQILQTINADVFRLGGGTSKGFGDIKVLNNLSSYAVMDVNSQDYRDASSSLNTSYPKSFTPEKRKLSHRTYVLNITPDDFFMFGSGFGEDDIKMTPTYEEIIDYGSEDGLGKKQILIPGSSIKGMLSHRTAFYYNVYLMKEKKKYTKVGEENDAVKAIFGHKKELAKDGETELGQKGRVLISDCFKTDEGNTKVFDHVSIDRFTGGAVNSALFNEQTIADNRPYTIEILLDDEEIDENYIKAFESALTDITTGMLALGGATTKGHGVFTGEWSKS